MNFNRLLFLSFFLLLPFLTFSQSKTFSDKIKWSDEVKMAYEYIKNKKVGSEKYLHFEGAKYYGSNLIPYYYKIIPVKFNNLKNVKFRNKIFSPVKHDHFAGKTEIKNEIELSGTIQKSKGQNYLVLRFIPLIINNQTGAVKKLSDFTVSYEYDYSEKTETKTYSVSRSNSVFSSGDWVKLRISKAGIYKLNYDDLKYLGINDFNRISVFGNSKGLLPVDNSDEVDGSLKQIPIEVFKGEDGIFNEGDYILFYAFGPHRWDYNNNIDFYEKVKHIYTDCNYYFITDDYTSSKQIGSLGVSTGPYDTLVTVFPDYAHHELNKQNLIKSGQRWYGEYFDITNEQTFSFNFPEIYTQIPGKVKARVAGRSPVSSIFNLEYNNQVIKQLPVGSVNYSHTGYFAKVNSGTTSFFPVESPVEITVDYNKPTASAVGWLDYLTVNCYRKLKMTGNSLRFRYRSASTGERVRFSISNVVEDIEIWDISDPENVKRIENYQLNNQKATFNILMDSVKRREFLAFYPGNYQTPQVVERVKNQNLRGEGTHDMIIVTKPRFKSQASSIAQIHRNHNDLKVKVVTDKQIYNEFSSGKTDPSAIRNYLKLVYHTPAPENLLKYLLLFGDGSYKNFRCGYKDELVTYQSYNSIDYTGSFVSDDFFGLLDSSENIEGFPSGLLDIGIGRLPVQDASEANAAVDKIRYYIKYMERESWLNRVCFVADDEDGNKHMKDADNLAEIVKNNNPEFYIDKLYADAYKQVNIATGERYPDMNEDINERVNNGVLIFNYSGHGGDDHLGHEWLLTQDDIASWSNFDKYPLFVTATCEFTRFDDPDNRSAGEKVIVKSEGGSIALFSTTRLVYSNLNYDLNSAFYDYVFTRDSENEPLRLGDIVRLTKINTGANNNKRNFTLFGDPAIQLPLGKYSIELDSVINNSGSIIDTLKSLAKITIKGHVEDESSNLLSGYNGNLYVSVLDKEVNKQTLANDGGSPFSYNEQNNLLFKGETQVEDGKFEFQWIVPRDILPGYDNGKILFLGYNNEYSAQAGNTNLIVGGYSDNQVDDDDGPEMEAYMNDEDFVSGGITDEHPTLVVNLTDSSGINISSGGIGHNLEAILDNKLSEKISLNNYYQASTDNYRKGKINYKFSEIEKGEHQLKIKAWDVNNNSSVTSLDFIVEESEEFTLEHVLNYPNPFTENTAFYFEHNRPNQSLKILLQVFTVSGKLVKTIRRQIYTDGFRVGPLPWNGLDDFGDKIGKGVYIYKLKVESENGETAEEIEKLVILK